MKSLHRNLTEQLTQEPYCTTYKLVTTQSVLFVIAVKSPLRNEIRMQLSWKVFRAIGSYLLSKDCKHQGYATTGTVCVLVPFASVSRVWERSKSPIGSGWNKLSSRTLRVPESTREYPRVPVRKFWVFWNHNIEDWKNAYSWSQNLAQCYLTTFEIKRSS
mgnify:CR=1 FL=1